MKTIHKHFSQLFLIVAILFTFSLSAWGEEVTATLSFANKAQRTSFSTSKQVWEQNGITLTNNKSSSTSNVADYANPARFYASSNIIIEVPGNIKTIVFTANSSSYATALKNSAGSEATASGSNVTIKPTATATTYTIAKLTAQVRLSSVKVTYTTDDGGSDEPDEPQASLTLSTTSINFGNIEQNSSVAPQSFTINASNLKGNVTISLDNNNVFSIDKTTIVPSNGSIDNVSVNVNLINTTTGSKTANVTISSTDDGINQQITLKANIYESHTITFGNIERKTNADGKIIDFPTEFNVTSCNNLYTKLADWVESTDFGIISTRPIFVNENTTFSKDTKLYPVFIEEGANADETWTLVKDVSSLTIGDEIVIVAKDSDIALSTNQKDNNRGQTSVTKNGDNITFQNDVQILTLEAGTKSNTFAFNTGTGYLYAASSGSNHLKTQDSNSDNGSWNITINDGTATIVAQGTNTRNTMQYNKASSLFACYASASQQAISIYKKIGGDAVEYYVCSEEIEIESSTTQNLEGEININTLIIKSNGDQAGQINVTNGSISANKVILEKTINASRWFFFSLPFACNVADIVAIAANGNSLTYDTHYVISKYNPTRAEGQNNAWEDLLGTDKLNANQGYIIGHWYKQSDTIIVKFPSTDAQTISAPKDKTLNYTDTWLEEGTNSSKGFNLIGMPYYQNINSTISCDSINIYSTTPNKDGKTYTQEKYTGNNVAPFTSFFVQVTENTAPKFTISTKSSSAPMLRTKDIVDRATITLTDANGGTDATTIINNPANTTDYEIGHDLVKWIGYASIPQIYSLQGDEMLAFNSLAIDNSTVIPLGVYAHTDGEYTFRLSEKSMGDLQGWELYDNETGKTTRLANEDLTIYLEQGTHEGRFEIRLQQRITTNCDNSMGDMMTWTANGTLNINNMPTDAVVYIYDAVGRMIYAATTNATTFNYNFVARGVYNIVVRTAENSVSFKTIY